MPKGGADVTVKVLEDYVSFVNSLDDEEVRRKVEEELGRKMVVLKMVLSVPNFAGTIAPVASDRIVTDTKPTS